MSEEKWKTKVLELAHVWHSALRHEVTVDEFLWDVVDLAYTHGAWQRFENIGIDIKPYQKAFVTMMTKKIQPILPVFSGASPAFAEQVGQWVALCIKAEQED
jgi:hypothetical protein